MRMIKYRRNKQLASLILQKHSISAPFFFVSLKPRMLMHVGSHLLWGKENVQFALGVWWIQASKLNKGVCQLHCGLAIYIKTELHWFPTRSQCAPQVPHVFLVVIIYPEFKWPDPLSRDSMKSMVLWHLFISVSSPHNQITAKDGYGYVFLNPKKTLQTSRPN
jgi:hypothetical protein